MISEVPPNDTFAPNTPENTIGSTHTITIPIAPRKMIRVIKEIREIEVPEDMVLPR